MSTPSSEDRTRSSTLGDVTGAGHGDVKRRLLARRRHALAELIADEASRYLAAVDVFTDQGCDPFEEARARAMADRLYDRESALVAAILGDRARGWDGDPT